MIKIKFLFWFPRSDLLKSILIVKKGAETNSIGFPYLNDLLNFYKENFDAEEAKKEGEFIRKI
jgi:hypothetical protein